MRAILALCQPGVILPSLERKLRKNALCFNQSTISNLALLGLLLAGATVLLSIQCSGFSQLNTRTSLDFSKFQSVAKKMLTDFLGGFVR